MSRVTIYNRKWLKYTRPYCNHFIFIYRSFLLFIFILSKVERGVRDPLLSYELWMFLKENQTQIEKNMTKNQFSQFRWTCSIVIPVKQIETSHIAPMSPGFQKARERSTKECEFYYGISWRLTLRIPLKKWGHEMTLWMWSHNFSWNFSQCVQLVNVNI